MRVDATVLVKSTPGVLANIQNRETRQIEICKCESMQVDAPVRFKSRCELLVSKVPSRLKCCALKNPICNYSVSASIMAHINSLSTEIANCSPAKTSAFHATAIDFSWSITTPILDSTLMPYVLFDIIRETLTGPLKIMANGFILHCFFGFWCPLTRISKPLIKCPDTFKPFVRRCVPWTCSTNFFPDRRCLSEAIQKKTSGVHVVARLLAEQRKQTF